MSMKNVTWLTVTLLAAFAAGCTPPQQVRQTSAAEPAPQVLLDDISAPVAVGTGGASGGGAADETVVATGDRIHTVVKGDTLFSLARQYYNDMTKWRLIAQANKNVIANPNVLPINARLVIPRP